MDNLPHSTPSDAAARNFLEPAACRVSDLEALISRRTEAGDYTLAERITQNVPLYDSAHVRGIAATPSGRRLVLTEWVKALLEGPGVIVLRRAFDHAVLNEATGVFEAIIAEQRASGAVAGDHFAKPGANDRIWNALEKLCLRAPEVFGRYYANDMLALVSEAWLGPAYQVTSQVNVVNPGGAAQSPHRDYHLGFQAPGAVARYPAHVHRLSPALTLQGAVAHCDMPVQTGPTLYLPFSQHYDAGYVASALPQFRACFAAHHIQLPLARGDAVFFNPALLHAAGDNRSADIRRTANLLQVSSAFGRAMETIDRTGMSKTLYPVLLALRRQGALDDAGCDRAIGACAEGYAFPTNLDRDPPVEGLAPASQQDVLRQALAEEWAPGRLDAALDAQDARRRS